MKVSEIKKRLTIERIYLVRNYPDLLKLEEISRDGQRKSRMETKDLSKFKKNLSSVQLTQPFGK